MHCGLLYRFYMIAHGELVDPAFVIKIVEIPGKQFAEEVMDFSPVSAMQMLMMW
jgi:hypothetical protein